MSNIIHWEEALLEEKKQDYFKEIMRKVKEERENSIVYPHEHDVFNALHYTPLSSVKVVILGQDPYHNPQQAHGLAFSVLPNAPIPPSLKNIYKELSNDINFKIPQHGCLIQWAEQGVLLLNTVLTVRENQAHSHKNFGWQRFSDKIIQIVNEHCDYVVFLLWGASAQQKQSLINRKKHQILLAPHPSPLSAHRGFLGCRHFSQCNKYLEQNKKKIIHWQLD